MNAGAVELFVESVWNTGIILAGGEISAVDIPKSCQKMFKFFAFFHLFQQLSPPLNLVIINLTKEEA